MKRKDECFPTSRKGQYSGKRQGHHWSRLEENLQKRHRSSFEGARAQRTKQNSKFRRSNRHVVSHRWGIEHKSGDKYQETSPHNEHIHLFTLSSRTARVGRAEGIGRLDTAQRNACETTQTSTHPQTNACPKRTFPSTQKR